MTIFIERFNPVKVPQKQTIKFEKKGWVSIDDRKTREPVAMVRLFDDYGKNQVLAAKIIELIESELDGAED